MTLSALALIGSIGIADVARAGCCDDFWSCLGAVATAGLSCQIQGIIDAVNAMKTLVETVTNDLRTRTGDVISQAQRAVTDASNDLKAVREQSMISLQKAVETAHQLANPPRGVAMAGPGVAPIGAAPARPAGAAVPTPAAPILQPSPGVAVAAPAMPRTADAKAIQDALTRADAYVQDLRTKANAPQTDVANAEKAAVDAAARHIRTAQQISLDLALAPLNLLRDSLLDLLMHPERIFDPTAQIEADIQRITAEIPALLDRIAGEVTQEAMANLDRAKANLQQLQDSAAAATSVADAMQKVSTSRLQSDLDALERFVPRPPPGATAVGTRAIAFPIGITVNRQAITAAFARTEPGRLPIVIQHRAAITNLASQWQNIKVKIKAPAQIEAASVQKVDRDLGQMFAGKQKVDIDKKKQELTEEAKKRFAKDPKTLDKVLRYIESHAKG
jgi:ElaB/YqjD/DUF883 family membrane-anchored ribosome-binding protein